MLLKLRERMSSEKGFTLIELLVVMLIIGILAAIAIPTFFNQKQKAQDSDSKAMAHTAQTAIETYAIDKGGDYTGATGGVAGNLHSIENTIDDTVSVVSADEESYDIRVTNDVTDHTFDVVRNADGSFEYPCAVEGEGGCPTGGWG
jgi:type IV pilus assembly protein PilA